MIDPIVSMSICIFVLMQAVLFLCWKLVYDDRKRVAKKYKMLLDENRRLKDESKRSANVIDILHQAKTDGAIVEITLIDKNNVYFHQGQK